MTDFQIDEVKNMGQTIFNSCSVSNYFQISLGIESQTKLFITGEEICLKHQNLEEE